MKKIVVILVIMVFVLAGCGRRDANFEPIGDNYTAILYSNDGSVIKEYKASSYMFKNDGIVLQVNNKPIYISGTIVIEPIAKQ